MKKNKALLLLASFTTLALLAGAAFQENVVKEWRGVQRRYRERLPAEARSEFPVQLRQIVVPKLDVTDRCVSCHVGMAPGESGIAGDRLFGRHPDVVHDPAEIGCVVCHGGQGRATEEADAHGEAPHWPSPMLPRKYMTAGCGACHTHLSVSNQALLGRGRDLFERHDCLMCHRVDGRGGTLRPEEKVEVSAPELSRAGTSGFDRDWYAKHLARHEKEATGPWRSGFGPVPIDEREAIEGFLGSRMGARGLVEAKALFHSLGCRGCHKVGGVGGDDGPDLTRVGDKDPGRLDFTRVPGGKSLTAWLAEHFRAPAVVVPGSAMPVLGLTEDQIDALTFYMMSLRRSEYPEAYWPKDRIRAERFDEREFATDGGTLFGTFCAACHGTRGEGMRYPGAPSFPAIGNADFLEIASDEFIRSTVTRGRPGRRMPAWGEKEGGLRPSEVEAVVGYVRRLGGGTSHVPDTKPARWIQADAAAGAKLWADNCTVCHGPKGEGKEGPAVNNTVLLENATDTYLLETIRRGRRATSMPPFGVPSPAHRGLSTREMESIVAHIRAWEIKG
jgi:cytochrome c oxidase cbb3-type subunit 3